MGNKKTLLWIIYIIDTWYRSLKAIRRCSFALPRLCLNLEPALPWCIYLDPALPTTYRRRCQEFGLQQPTELVCRRRRMQLALLYSELDYLTYNPTSRHGTGYTSTWPRPTVEPMWLGCFMLHVVHSDCVTDAAVPRGALRLRDCGCSLIGAVHGLNCRPGPCVAMI